MNAASSHREAWERRMMFIDLSDAVQEPGDEVGTKGNAPLAGATNPDRMPRRYPTRRFVLRAGLGATLPGWGLRFRSGLQAWRQQGSTPAVVRSTMVLDAGPSSGGVTLRGGRCRGVCSCRSSRSLGAKSPECSAIFRHPQPRCAPTGEAWPPSAEYVLPFLHPLVGPARWSYTEQSCAVELRLRQCAQQHPQPD